MLSYPKLSYGEWFSLLDPLGLDGARVQEEWALQGAFPLPWGVKLFHTESFRLLSPGWDPKVQILCYYSYPHTLGGHEGPWGRGLPGAL